MSADADETQQVRATASVSLKLASTNPQTSFFYIIYTCGVLFPEVKGSGSLHSGSSVSEDRRGTTKEVQPTGCSSYSRDSIQTMWWVH